MGSRFPFEARSRLIEALRIDDGRTPEKAAAAIYAVVTGFFYRDHNDDGEYSVGEEFPGAILGTPLLNGASASTYFNCFWSAPLSPGTSVTLSFQAAGVASFERSMVVQPGLNFIHIPIVPTRPLIYVVPHSHFDTEWRFTYEDYLAEEVPNLRSRLDLMRREPSHCFSFDEECVTIPFMERSDADYRERLRKGIRDGMVEPKGLVTQQELTMPYGESLVRCITMGERLLSELMGESVRPQVYWCVDHYGMGVQMAQMLRKSGREYLLIGEYSDEHIPYSEPGLGSHQAFWLRAPDGSSILTYRGFYGGEVEPTAIPPAKPHQCGLQFLGEDNCAPRPKLVSEVQQVNQTQDEFTYAISTTLPFYRALEHDSKLPTFETESFVTRWCGIYESRLGSKINNRKLENRILVLEALTACTALAGKPIPAKIEAAWYQLILNQHHDPLMSIMARVGLYQSEIPARFERCRQFLEEIEKELVEWLIAQIDTTDREGEPLVIFNPLPVERSAVLEIGNGTGKRGKSDVYLVDEMGEPVRCQPIESSDEGERAVFMAAELPPLGWRTYYVTARSPREGVDSYFTGDHGEREADAVYGHVVATTICLENEHMRVELADGRIERVIEKHTNTEVLCNSADRGVCEIVSWKDEGCISIIRPMDNNGVVDFLHNEEAVLVARSNEVRRLVSVIEKGPLRGKLKIEFELDWGRFQQFLELEIGSRLLRLTTRIDWDPTDKIATFDGRRVRMAMAIGFGNARIVCDTPFGVVPWKQAEQIRPVNSWLAAESSDCGVALFHKGTHSVQVVEDVFYATLIRSVLEPEFGEDDDRACKWDAANDEAAEAGVHILEHGLFVYPGDWKSAAVPKASRCFNADIAVVPAIRGGGCLPATASYLQIEPQALVTSAIKPSEYREGYTVLRLFNPTDNPVDGCLTIGFDHGVVDVVDFREEMVDTLNGGNPYWFDVQPHEIVTLCIEPGKER